MTYVTGGDLVDRRTIWRVSIVSDFFWGVVNFVGLLYDAVTSQDPSSSYSGRGGSGGGNSGSSGRGGGSGGPRRMGGINHQRPINQPSMSTVTFVSAIG
ncbi:TPA: hypothetical protein N0F65_007654 [Lagenidium giganteum]|uniref:Selenoprotein K n=1 Tax=Lagenidium giganteum TaxID=4803 RepID=A0AAV2Z8A3_9STRA|nr:TPA: hypothetical protein N0F65_007654 [Lagenidium giganteum]